MYDKSWRFFEMIKVNQMDFYQTGKIKDLYLKRNIEFAYLVEFHCFPL